MSKLLLLVCIILVSISCIYAQQSNCPYGTIPGTMVVGNNNQRVRVVRIAADQLASSSQADNMIAKSMACAWWKLFTAAKSSGHDLKITSGFRTLQRQQELYNRYRQGNGPLAARPGTSNHGSGNAIDINARGAASQWLQANAGRYGFSRTIPAEPWHYVYGSVQGKNEMELDESELDEAELDEANLDESELELDEANIQEEESIDESESELDEAKSDNNSIEQGPAWNALPIAEKIRRLQVRHDAVKAEWDRLRVRTARTLPESQKLSAVSRTMNLLSRRLVFYRQQQSREAMLNRNRNRTNEGEFDDAEVDDAEVDEEVANVDEAQVDEVQQVKPNHATPRPIHRMAKNIKVEVDVNAK